MAAIKPESQRRKAFEIITTPARSTWIAGFQYDEENLRLTTHLFSGAIYQHVNVTPGDFEGLTKAQNCGKFWSDNIRGKKESIVIKTARAPRAFMKPRR